MTYPSSSTSSGVFLALLVFSWLSVSSSSASSLAFDIHHRFSSNVRRWAEANSWDTGDVWPEKGSIHYYASLVAHDRALLHRRGLATAGKGDQKYQSSLTFEDGNSTIKLNNLGFLHYANISLGMPKLNFLVALDTGSDLLWVPCNCKNCAPTSNEDYDLKFNIYDSKSSITSQMVPCSSSYCDRASSCDAQSDPCPYKVEYLTPNLSTSGVLIQDVLHLTTEDTKQKVVNANITFGCSRKQTGHFQSSASPNGLLGLGMEKLSIPSILASQGLTSDSFSMCFGLDSNVGRIHFGDNGTLHQNETPLNLDLLRQKTYVVSIVGLRVGKSLMVGNTFTIIDTGSSFTTLTDPLYTNLTNVFDSQITDERYPSIQGIPFEYCYNLNADQKSIFIPRINFQMEGGSNYPLLNPIVVIGLGNNQFMYCLGITKDDRLPISIFGQNFMAGLQMVFDRENLVLGWKESDCSSTSSTQEAMNPSSSPSTKNTAPLPMPPATSIVPKRDPDPTIIIPNTNPRIDSYSAHTRLRPIVIWVFLLALLFFI